MDGVLSRSACSCSFRQCNILPLVIGQLKVFHLCQTLSLLLNISSQSQLQKCISMSWRSAGIMPLKWEGKHERNWANVFMALPPLSLVESGGAYRGRWGGSAYSLMVEKLWFLKPQLFPKLFLRSYRDKQAKAGQGRKHTVWACLYMCQTVQCYCAVLMPHGFFPTLLCTSVGITVHTHQRYVAVSTS